MPSTPSEASHPPDAPSPVYRTLVVDDDEQWRYLVKLLLGRTRRFDVVAEAEDGAAAIERAQQAQPDLVLLDLRMPVMRGEEALPELRRVAPESRVVVLSGLDKHATAPKLIELGAAGYIEKGGPPGSMERELLGILEGDAQP